VYDACENQKGTEARLAETGTETEARQFIALQVKRELSGHVRWFITAFGIANVLAVIAAAVAIAGMWFTIQNATQTAAVNVATQEASRISHELVDPISKLTENTYKSFSDRYSQLEEKRIRLDTSVSERESELKKLQQELSDRNADVSKLKDAVVAENNNLSVVASNLEGVKNAPTAQLAAVVNSLSKEGLSLLPILGQIVDELNHSYEYGITVLHRADLGAPSRSES
jgi:septal ring factor EnvC (AmiA/AmiB activator)